MIFVYFLSKFLEEFFIIIVILLKIKFKKIIKKNYYKNINTIKVLYIYFLKLQLLYFYSIHINLYI